MLACECVRTHLRGMRVTLRTKFCLANWLDDLVDRFLIMFLTNAMQEDDIRFPLYQQKLPLICLHAYSGESIIVYCLFILVKVERE